MRRPFENHTLPTLALLFLAVLGATIAPAQAPAPPQPNHDPRDFDATALGKHVVVGPSWLFAGGDNPAWASPSLDDSDWKVISAEKNLTDFGVRDTPYAWYRIHIRLRPGARDVAVGMATIRGLYSVYANGVLIGNNGAGTAGLVSIQRALTVYSVPNTLLANSGDLVLAIRCSIDWNAHTRLHDVTPIGPNSIYLFDQGTAPIYISFQVAHAAGAPALLSGIALLAGLIALALFFALRSQMEYLAIAICLFASALNAATLVWFSLAFSSFPLFFLQFMFIGVEMVALIEFVRLVLHLDRTRWLLALEIVSFVAFLIYPLHDVGYLSNTGLFVGFYVPVLVMKIALPVLLIRGWLKGNREALLLLPSILLGCFADYWSFLRDLAFYTHFTSLLRYLPFQANLGTYQIDFYRMGDLAFYIAILLFLVGRTVRIARERSQAAAELEAARTVQQVLIPDEIPTIPGFVLRSTYKPAGQVGGDFFQFIPLKTGGVLVVIGDVSGKGMPAAMTVSLLVGTVRTLAHFTQSPGQILAAMNQRMMARSGGGFTTCLVLRADPNGTLTIANAGHIAPYLAGPHLAGPQLAGKELPLDNGLPLGIAAETAYPESVFQLAQGEQLTLLSDGVVEARDKAGVLFGFDRTAAITGQSADQIAEAAELFGQEDDITALTLARTA